MENQDFENMESSQIAKEIIKELAAKKIKLSEPQKALFDKFINGYKLITVNEHRVHGGELMWIKNDDLNSIDYAGRVYKAFQHLNWKINPILKNLGIKDDPFYSKIRGVKYY
jgi:hypothetical protein